MTKRKAINPRAEPSVEQMFEDRMLRENRWEEYKKAREDIGATIPQETEPLQRRLRGRKVKSAAMKQCGFEDAAKEKALYRQWKEYTERIKPAQEAGATAKTFDEAHKTLPTSADTQVENEWVRAHPAMARKSRLDDQSKRVIITGSDLLNAHHGPCPSKGAANKLQYWANKPEKFYEAQTHPMKKGDDAATEKDNEVVIDDGIDELERAYKALTNG